MIDLLAIALSVLVIVPLFGIEIAWQLEPVLLCVPLGWYLMKKRPKYWGLWMLLVVAAATFFLIKAAGKML